MTEIVHLSDPNLQRTCKKMFLYTRLKLNSQASRKHLRTKVTTDLHLTFEIYTNTTDERGNHLHRIVKKKGNLGLVLKRQRVVIPP